MVCWPKSGAATGFTVGVKPMFSGVSIFGTAPAVVGDGLRDAIGGLNRIDAVGGFVALEEPVVDR